MYNKLVVGLLLLVTTVSTCEVNRCIDHLLLLYLSPSKNHAFTSHISYKLKVLAKFLLCFNRSSYLDYYQYSAASKELVTCVSQTSPLLEHTMQGQELTVTLTTRQGCHCYRD